MQNYYEILGIDPSADQGTVREALNAAIRGLQADINSIKKEIRERAEQKMKILMEARKILLDPRRRKDYDARLNIKSSSESSTTTNQQKHNVHTLEELPQRVRDLIRRINKQIVDPYYQTIERINNQYERATTNIQKNYQRKLNDAKAELESAKSRIESRLNRAKLAIEPLEDEIPYLLHKAQEHFKKQLGTPPSFPKTKLRVKISNPIQAAKEHVSHARALFQDVEKTSRSMDEPRLGIGATLGFLTFAGILVLGLANFWLAVVAGFIAYMICIAARYYVLSTKLRQRYVELVQELDIAEACLSQYRQKTHQAASREELEAEERFRQQGSIIKKQYHQALDEAKANREQELLDFYHKLAPLVKKLHQVYLKLIQVTDFSNAAWNDPIWNAWKPVNSPRPNVRIGTLHPALTDLKSRFPALDLEFSLPALLSFRSGKGLLFKAHGAARKQAMKALQSLVLRLLANTPPGKLRLTFIDPVGLGQNVAAFMPLADYEESLVSGKAWTESQHIEQRLSDLTEHMETVIQKYLRTDYASIEDYNQQAGEVAEPYRLLVVMDFPVNFSETAARRLVSIAQNGPRCGVYTFIVMDTSKPLPYGFDTSDLERVTTVIAWDKKQKRFVWEDDDFRSCFLELDKPPGNKPFKSIITSIGERAKEAMKVEVPYEKLLQLAGLTEDAWWQGTTAKKIQVPLGPTGARKPLYLILGEGTANHALIVGRTGSGKSNLMHVLITTLALAYSPDEIHLYLVDFKKGVEFKPYAEAPLPHAKVIAIESEREFGLSVLQGLNAELQRRGELFRNAGVSHIAEYRQKTRKKMPRILLLVDEFQEFFVQDDEISRQASQILDRLARQGRAFGIHIVLGSQTLAGSYTLARSTIDQMAVRIALQCSEADSRLILAEDNTAARSLSRPGEAIYNAASGLVEGNNPFQVALFKEEDRSRYLNSIAQLAKRRKLITVPIVFEGHEPARIEACQPLNELLSSKRWPTEIKTVQAWLGEPVAIRPPTAARFRRQSGSHLLVVTRNESEGVGLLTASVISLAVQHRPDAARFYIVDLTTADGPAANLPDEIANLLPHEIEVIRRRRDIPKLLDELVAEVNQRLDDLKYLKKDTLYLIIMGLHRARDLRQEELSPSFRYDITEEEKHPSPPEQFATLLREGPEVGVHVLAWCDTVANAMRVLDRQMLGEFGMRVAGAMSNEDSHKFLDDAAAARLDKPHRVIFFDEERPGFLEKFRPYAIPGKAWLEHVAKRLRARRGGK